MAANINVREARKPDAEQIFELMKKHAVERNLGLPEHLTKEGVEEWGWGTPPVFLCFVAEAHDGVEEGEAGSKGVLEGYILACFTYSTWNGRAMCIREVYVAPALRRTGVAMQLCRRVTEAGLEKGCVRCDMRVEKTNEAGAGLCERLGAKNLTQLGGWNLFNMSLPFMLQLQDTRVKLGSGTVRRATPKDYPTVMALIQELAEYENMPDGPQITAQTLGEDALAPERFLDAFVAEVDEEVVGYVLFFYTFASLGRGVYMEDIYVRESCRGHGLGTSLWQQVIKLGLETGAKQCEFSVLDWNTPSIAFYNSKGAVDKTKECGVQLYRLELEDMKQLVQGK